MSKLLTTLHLQFDLPRSVIETGSESRLPTPHDKNLITKLTFNRLKRLVIHFNTEPLFISWVDTYALFTECHQLEHLEVVRKLKYQSLAK